MYLLNFYLLDILKIYLKLIVMNAFKEFLIHIRKVSYKNVYIIIEMDIFPYLTRYVSLIENVNFEEGSYQNYYGKMKSSISSFITFWKFTIDHVIQEADRCANIVDRDELLFLIEQTIYIHQDRQIAFARSFLPVYSFQEKQAYEDMEQLYYQYMFMLYELKAQIEKMDKREKIENFVKEHFKTTVEGTTELFETTHVFLSMMLADRIRPIRVSLEEILLRTRKNLRDIQAENEQALVRLLWQLYDKNKELLDISRQARRFSIEQAEAGHSIEMIRAKIESCSFDSPSRLEEEVAYWESRLADFLKSADKLVELKKELEDIINQEGIYYSMRSRDLPGSKKQCWLNMGQNFAERKQYLNEKIIEVAKTLITHFAVLGADRILYTDDLGQYYVDEFKHQVYVFDYGLGLYHLTCDGYFTAIKDDNIYYYDKFGRYKRGADGEKIYQCDTCTSEYKMVPGNLLEKITADCGHSSALRQKCRHTCKDEYRPGELVPDVMPTDIRNTLTPETIRYLWDSVGPLLPDALHDIGCDRTKNPIQYLAHKLLLHKYNNTKTVLAKKVKEAEEYRANIFKERKEKAIAMSRAWKAKQVKPRKPEESDDREVRQVQAAAAAAVAAHTEYQ